MHRPEARQRRLSHRHQYPGTGVCFSQQIYPAHTGHATQPGLGGWVRAVPDAPATTFWQWSAISVRRWHPPRAERWSKCSPAPHRVPAPMRGLALTLPEDADLSCPRKLARLWNNNRTVKKAYPYGPGMTPAKQLDRLGVPPVTQVRPVAMLPEVQPRSAVDPAAHPPPIAIARALSSNCAWGFSYLGFLVFIFAPSMM